MHRNALGERWHFLRSYFSSGPSYLILFATARCNARCRHCFYWQEVADADVSKELTLSDLEKVADSVSLIYLSIGGGEPFLRKDLAAVVEAFHRRSGILYRNIVTNGFYTERIVETVREVRRRCPRLRLKIQISLDDFAEAHDAYRKVPGIYEKAVQTLKRLSREARETVDWIRRTHCSCSFECGANCNVVFSPRQAARALITRAR